MVDSTINEMGAHQRALTETGMSAEEAKLIVEQIHLRNMEQMSDPAHAAVNLLAELKTRIDIDRATQISTNEDGSVDLLSPKYVKLLEEMRKTIDLVSKTQGRTLTVRTQSENDAEMRFTQFIDVEDEK